MIKPNKEKSKQIILWLKEKLVLPRAGPVKDLELAPKKPMINFLFLSLSIPSLPSIFAVDITLIKNEAVSEDVPKQNTLTKQAFATDYDLKNERKLNELILTI